ncbi:hypothetical protein Tlie_1524 [Thermovirga lienii DSM 17291]|jgi:dienelactone hydrolase|uniref:Uncharacterized protein n=1 Tax=Thermovirga lienii (strain ATCC BAA-1197 / DSM 17291 / Cas60314) TaxID=580340 RepID=G7V7D0_THELD|nr:alpha/beta hydrolase [Thermovirga lienii]AER67246.1 hypothetical protein Tlie_1524 [Thermovirga lienii DSM 17291]MDN5368496.1 hypothetical protein [Thermovirga sp.]HCD71707.1 alpha/beta hydrolase [Thermovirga lienii]
MNWQEIAESGHYGDKIVRITVPHEPQRIERAPVVILLHGVHGCANAEPGNKYLHIAQALVNMGINAAMIETSRAQRNPELYGDDRVAWAIGAFSGKTFEEDLADNLVGINRIKKDFPHSALWLWGFSLGGIHSVIIASKKENPLDGLILSGSGIELTKEGEKALNLPILNTMPQREELKKAAKHASTKKVIAFWGSEDNIFSKESCMALVDLIPIPPKNKEFHIIKGADHSFRLMKGKQSTEPIKAMIHIVGPQILQGHGASNPK